MLIQTQKLSINWNKLFELLKEKSDVITNEDLSLGYITESQTVAHYDMIDANTMQVSIEDIFDTEPFVVSFSEKHQLSSIILKEYFFDLISFKELLERNIIQRGNVLYLVTNIDKEARVNGIYTSFNEAYDVAQQIDAKQNRYATINLIPVNTKMNALVQ